MKPTCLIEQGDCIEWLNRQAPDSCDLIFGSPPYMDARLYLENGSETGSSRDCQEWVDWMLDVTTAAVRVSKSLVLWVVAGVQRDLNYWPGCEGLTLEWWKRGNHLWRPCIWWKVDENEGGTGIPGSGGKQWLRNDWEYVLAFKKQGWLPWADNTAMGHEPIYDRVGGEMSNRTVEGQRINAEHGPFHHGQNDDPWQKRGRGNSLGGREKNGKKKLGTNRAPGSTRRDNGEYKHVARMDSPAGTNGDGTRKENVNRPMPKIANPGNCVIVKARVGGGHMGSTLCHNGEAPFPEDLARFFIRSFAPPGGTVCDPFSGSGTTASVCVQEGRNFIGCDLRQSQVNLGLKRVGLETPTLFPE